MIACVFQKRRNNKPSNSNLSSRLQRRKSWPFFSFTPASWPFYLFMAEKSTCASKCFFQRNLPFGQVKYFCEMWNTPAACEIFADANTGKFHFTSNRAEGGVRYFTIHEVNYFTFGNSRIFHFFLPRRAKTVDRFEPAKAFLREEGGTRSVTEGACATLKFD